MFALAAGFVRLLLRAFRPREQVIVDPYPDADHPRLSTFADDMV